MQCWENMKLQFPSAAREEPVVKTFFKLLCFRAEAVSGMRRDRIGYVGMAFRAEASKW